MRTAGLQLALFVVFAFLRPLSANAAQAQDKVDTQLGNASEPSSKGERPADPAKASSSSIHSAASTITVQELSVSAGARSAFEKGRRLLMEEHRAEESLVSLHKAVQIAPAYWEAQFLLGVAYMDLRKWGDAEPPLRQAIARNEDLGAASLALGSCLLEEGKYSEAEQRLLKGLELDPDATHGHYDLSRTYYALGRFEEAKWHGLKAIDLGPANADVHFLLGNILLRLAERQNALAEFQECVRLAPGRPLAALARDEASRLQSQRASVR